MILVRAVLYRLFAGSGALGDVRIRATLFILSLALLAGLVYRVTPKAMYEYSPSGALSLLFVLIFLFTTTLYAFTASAQAAFLQRLEILRKLPLGQMRIRSLLLIGYAPITLLGATIIVSAACGFLSGRLGLITTICATVLSFCLVALANILLRTTAFKFSKYAQPASLISVFLGLVLAWKMVIPLQAETTLQMITLCIVFLHMGLIAFLLRLHPKIGYVAAERPIRERQRLGVMTGLILRASRTRRYRNANFTLAAMFFGLTFVARASPVVSFDAVAAAALLLVGTFGQEARCISKCRYTIEQVRYGLFNRWLISTWILAFANALICVIAVTTVVALFFANDNSLSLTQIVCVSVCLVSIAVTIGSIIVPANNDILTQLAGAFLYSSLAWVVFRFIGREGGGVPQLVICSGLTVICLCASYIWEKARWLTSVRIKHANIFQK